MPTYLLKAAPDDHRYVAWSTVVEAPVWIGGEEDVLHFLVRERRCEEPCCYQTQVLDRFHRAHMTGTSSLDGFYGFESSGIIAEQRGVLPRECVYAYGYALLIDNDRDAADGYLQPFEDEVSCLSGGERR